MKPISAEIVSLNSEDKDGYYKRKRIWFPISQIQIYNTFEELGMDRGDPYIFEQYMTVNVHKDLFYYINCYFHRIEFLNKLAAFLRTADKIEQKILLAAIQYESSYDYDIILDIIDNFDDYEFYDGMDVSTICYVLQFLDDLKEMQHCDNFTVKRYFDIWEVLDRTITIVDENGYVKSGEQGCTSDKVKHNLMSSNSYILLHTDIVKSMIDWILSINANNDYLHNLQIICKSRYVDYKDLSILISMYTSYLKACEKERSAKVKNESTHVGNVGDKITINVKNWRPVTGYETQWGYMLIIEFIDENGNVYIWKTQSFDESKFEKENLVISATIKEHNIYNDIKQTVITRCKVK